MKTILFACVHNAGRSQMAAAWFNELADPTRARAISAGTAPGPSVHPEVLASMREVGIDLASAQPRFLSDELAAQASWLITMGCGDACPVVPGVLRADWPLEDPKGKPLERVRAIRDEVRARVVDLIAAHGWGRLERQGGCQCGRVRYRVSTERSMLVACHCTECQRQSGSAFGMSLIVPSAAFILAQGELKLFERTSESGRPLRCYFCPDCGTRVYHQPSYMEGIANIKAGTLDDTSWLTPELHTWTQSRQRWFELPDSVKQHPRQP